MDDARDVLVGTQSRESPRAFIVVCMIWHLVVPGTLSATGEARFQKSSFSTPFSNAAARAR